MITAQEHSILICIENLAKYVNSLCNRPENTVEQFDMYVKLIHHLNKMYCILVCELHI